MTEDGSFSAPADLANHTSLINLLDLLESVGGDANAIRLGLANREGNRSEETLTSVARLIWQMLEQQDPPSDIGLETGRLLMPYRLGSLGMTTMRSRDLDQMTSNLRQLTQAYLGRDLSISMLPQGVKIAYCWTEGRPHDLAADFNLSVINTMIRWTRESKDPTGIPGPSFRIVRVGVQHDGSHYRKSYENTFNAPVEFCCDSDFLIVISP